MEIRTRIHTYQKPLVPIASRMLGDPEEARDAVQETFIRHWERRVRTASVHLRIMFP